MNPRGGADYSEDLIGPRHCESAVADSKARISNTV